MTLLTLVSTVWFRLVAVLFTAFYLMGLAAGAAPEMALARAGGAGIILAVLGRLATSLLSPSDPIHSAASQQGSAGRESDQDQAGSPVSGQPATAE